MEIPQNTTSDDTRDYLIRVILKDLDNSDTSQSYRGQVKNAPLAVVKDVCNEFVRKGYHASITYFCDGRAPYQSFKVSKKHVSDRCGSAIYIDVLG